MRKESNLVNRNFDNKNKLAKITFVLSLIYPLSLFLPMLIRKLSRFGGYYIFTLWIAFYNSLFQIIYIRRDLPKKNIILIIVNILLLIALFLVDRIVEAEFPMSLLKIMLFPFGYKFYRK